jgi:hypothetical protein
VRHAKRILAAAATVAIVVLGGAPSAASSETPARRFVEVRPQVTIPAKVPALVRNYGHEEMQGYAPSVYRGKYYRASQESWRKCVMWRESKYRYGARNKSGSSAAGAYQFLDHAWRKRSGSLPWMMHAENKKRFGAKHAAEILTVLRATPIERWGRPWQDQAFFTALNYNGPWSGKHHWNATVPGTGC